MPSANILPGCALVQQVGHGSGVALGPVAAAQLRTAALLRVLGRQVVPQSLQAAAFILHSNMSPRNLAEASCGGGLGNQSRVARYHVWACVLRIAGPEMLVLCHLRNFSYGTDAADGKGDGQTCTCSMS